MKLAPQSTNRFAANRPACASVFGASHWDCFGAGCLVLGVGLLVLGALVSGCAGSKPATPANSSAPIVWPAPPDPPRIAYVQSVFRPADLGARDSTFSRVGRWLTGSQKGNEPLIRPFGLALDEQDNLCLTDTGANTVSFFDRSRKKWRHWDTIGTLRFGAPVAIAKRQGTIYVADSALGSVVSFDENGKSLRVITNHLQRPSGLVILSNLLFVADSQRHCIVSFGLDGTYRSEFGQRGLAPGQFNFPTHLAADTEGNLLVTDSMNSRVQILDQTGHCKGQIGQIGDTPGHFGRPKGVAVDSLGHVYVLDALFDNLQIFDREGRLLLNLGDAGAQPGQFWLPNGIAVSRSHEIFVADAYNHRVQVLKYVGPS